MYDQMNLNLKMLGLIDVNPTAGANSDPGVTFLVALMTSREGSCFLQ